MAPIELSHSIVQYDHKRAVNDIKYASEILKTPSFLAYDPSFNDLLGPNPKITLVEERDYQFAHEAGVYIKSTDSNYFTANFQTCDPVHLYRVGNKDHKIEQLDHPDIIQANGACNYRDKVLYCAQGDKSQPSSLTLLDPATGKTEVLLNNFYGREFNSINDVVVHHETGDIWFTDPTYGWEQAFRPPPQLPSQIYRFRPSTGQIWLVADGFEQCNGLCFSPDYKRMYVTDTGARQAFDGPGDGHQIYHKYRLPATIYAYDVVDGELLRSRQTFAFCDTGIPDGIKCDEHGNVYSGCGDGVHVWDTKGTIIGKIIVGGTVANFNFVKGGIWMMGEEKMYFCELKAKGTLVSIECE